MLPTMGRSSLGIGRTPMRVASTRAPARRGSVSTPRGATARPATVAFGCRGLAPGVIVAPSASTMRRRRRAEMDARRVDGAAERAGHRRRVDEPPGTRSKGISTPASRATSSSRVPRSRPPCRPRSDRRWPWSRPARARRRGSRRHALAGQDAGAAARGVGEERADERHDLHVSSLG